MFVSNCTVLLDNVDVVSPASEDILFEMLSYLFWVHKLIFPHLLHLFHIEHGILTLLHTPEVTPRMAADVDVYGRT